VQTLSHELIGDTFSVPDTVGRASGTEFGLEEKPALTITKRSLLGNIHELGVCNSG